ncbi:MAG: dual specificity protein phosphatase family protein [Helicobacteraceae bacterium]|jgi:protein tyrosine/serine phosphatase|nr:dual specificity protein phosphatase family protein [Helicobacteraceae bacterium]
MINKLFHAAFALTLIFAAPCLAEEWATPIELEGAPNLHRVTDSIYRSAQPTAEGFKNLQKLGVKTVINLRKLHNDDEELSGTELRAIHVKMEAWDPEAKEVIRVLKILNNPEGAPYLVHCQHGADRTGLVIGAYRMVVQRWSKEEAIAEMTEGGYGFHTIWKDIPKFLRRMDVEAIRKRL